MTQSALILMADKSRRAGAATVAKLVSSKAMKAAQKKKAPTYERPTPRLESVSNRTQPGAEDARYYNDLVECPHLDSNQGPADYESAALTD